MPRRMALVELPLPDEALLSWVDHNTAALGLTRSRTATALGLMAAGPSTGLRLQNLTHWISDATAARIQAATGIQRAASLSLTLRRYQPAALRADVPPPDELRPVSPQGMLSGQFVYRQFITYCPTCVREQGRWSIAWHLPWTFTCPRHHCYLAGVCPACQNAVAPSRGPLTSGCTAPIPAGSRPTRRHPGHTEGYTRRCGADLGTAHAVAVEDTRVSAAQQYVNNLLDAPTRCGAAARQALIDVRTMMAVALRFGRLEHLKDADPAVCSRFNEFTTRRDGLPHAYIYGVWGARAPFDPLLMAAGVRIAHLMVTSPDPSAVLASVLPCDGPQRRERSFAFDRTDWVQVSPRYEQLARRAIGIRAYEACVRKVASTPTT
ncbi:TniQ family protein [Streptomyces sp. H10-C2]|uniref:TniQ family protein n=1 Tax=unclassified Streptomyces TaxID=2593676 RepID=UPI0024BB04D6|nr:MULTISPECIES: TniQ family protein [unclassified Streptomyces]MDJ0340437.1 TniQ family protein [Streptomyces sp. PH10-H1]MDJ0368115.1 TniQ family protein [Streptomyces sp. H10-C2]